MKRGFLSIFSIDKKSLDLKTEIEGGIATFFTMCYIIFVQPVVLSKLNMDPGSVMIATCLSSAIACFAMGILANYPVALAPGMGHNFLFVAIATSYGLSFQQALGIVFVSGMLFVILSFVPFREKILNDIPIGIKHGISVGIGFLITLIGLEWAGIVVGVPGTYVGLGKLNSPSVLITFFGFIVIIFLTLKGIRSAIIWGILTSTFLSILFGLSHFSGVIDSPPSIKPTFWKFELSKDFFSLSFINVVFTFLFLDVFDTVGTLVGVGEQGKFLVNGKLPRAKQAFLADALGTVAGSVLGTSTVTSYIESASGISVGAKTGIASIVTGLLFLLSIFFYPLVKTVGSSYITKEGLILYPTIAPALIFVGFLMIANIKKIEFTNYEESIPAFLSVVLIPLGFSIADGIAISFITYCFIKALLFKFKEVSIVVYILTLIFLLRYIFS
ncbi:MAG: NCS2 family permease [Proteobacteria bacterium]|nr:NCS2 family permease [Pseudomonadota bacterium]